MVRELQQLEFRGLLVMCSGDSDLQLDKSLAVHAMLPKTKDGAFGPHLARLIGDAWGRHRLLYKEKVVVVDDNTLQLRECSAA